MSTPQQRRAEILTQLIAGKLSTADTAQLLRVSHRQVQRLRRRILTEGLSVAVHGNQGRAPRNRTDPALIERLHTLCGAGGKYHDFNISHLCDLLARHEEIKLARSTLSRLDIYYNVSDETYIRHYGRDSIVFQSSYADPEATILEFYRNRPADELWQLADWNSPTGHIAYKALALYHFSKASTRIRENLKNKFEEYKGSYIEKKTAEFTELDAQFPNSIQPELNLFSSWMTRSRRRTPQEEAENTPGARAKRAAESKENDYTAAALAGLVEHGDQSDIEFGQEYLLHEKYEVRVEAVRVVRQFGSETDAQALIGIAKSTEGILQEEAAHAVMSVAPGVGEAARALLETGDNILVGIAIGRLLEEGDIAATAKFLEPFLDDEKDKVRIRALAYFTKKYGTEELEQLLQRYTSRSRYYYDIVCWLDRIVYAPSRLKEMYKRRLEGEIILALRRY